MTHHGLGFIIFPTSWRLGTVRKKSHLPGLTSTIADKPGKWVFAIGPFRITYHKV